MLPAQNGHINSFIYFKSPSEKKWYFKNLKFNKNHLPTVDVCSLSNGLSRVYKISFFDLGWRNLLFNKEVHLDTFFDFSAERYKEVYGVDWHVNSNSLKATRKKGPPILLKLEN